jgi:hypothetical protein
MKPPATAAPANVAAAPVSGLSGRFIVWILNDLLTEIVYTAAAGESFAGGWPNFRLRDDRLTSRRYF